MTRPTQARAAMGDLAAITRLVGFRPARFALSVGLGLVASLSGVALLAVSGYLICRSAQQPPILSLTALFVAVRALALLRPGARYAERLSSHDLAFRSLGRLRGRVFERVEPLAPAGLEAFRDGDLLTRMVADVDELQDLVLRVLLPLAVAVPTALVVAAGVGWADAWAGLALLAGLVVCATVPPGIAFRVAARSQRQQAGRRARLTTDLVEVLSSAPELWLNGAEDRAAELVVTDDADLVGAAEVDARAAGWADGAAVTATGLTGLAVLALTTAAAGRGDLDPLLVAPATLVVAVAFEVVAALSVAARALPAVLGAGRRVLDITGREPEVVDPARPCPPPGPSPTIDLEGVSVERGPERTPVLSGVDLSVGPAGRVVVVGPSGAGKSTLLLLLARFLERSGGRADLAGRDLRAYAQDDVRAEVLLLAQDGHVFNSDLRQNVVLARPGSSDDEVTEALTRARLGDWLASLPEGLDTPVGELGRTLSGGQRQRLNMARAFLAGPSALLLDEPTAHLDTTTAAALLDDLAVLADGRSVVLVSHGDAGPFEDAAHLRIGPVAPPGPTG